MIQSDQPTIFGTAMIGGVSSIDDGNMKFGRGDDNETKMNRIAFLRHFDIDPTQATLVQVSYEDTVDFTRYHVIDDSNEGEGMLAPVSDLHADALVTTRPGQALFLPLADCLGAIIYDPENEIMMVSHLGRHSIEQQGGEKSIRYLIDTFGSEPNQLRVWLSPSVGSDSYPLHVFQDRSLREVALEQFQRAGINLHNIQASESDTAEDDNYYSHSEYLAGNQMDDGRFAIVAMMRD